MTTTLIEALGQYVRWIKEAQDDNHEGSKITMDDMDAELLQQAIDRIDYLETLISVCKNREYNPFEPDNQSELYQQLDKALPTTT